jgi:hypothetical protein
VHDSEALRAEERPRSPEAARASDVRAERASEEQKQDRSSEARTAEARPAEMARLGEAHPAARPAESVRAAEARPVETARPAEAVRGEARPVEMAGPAGSAPPVERSPEAARPVEGRVAEAARSVPVEPRAAERAGAPRPLVAGESAPRDTMPRAAAPFGPAATPELRWLRPGAIGARAESLASLVDVRALSAWGTPTSTLVSGRLLPNLAYVAPATSGGGPVRYIQFVDQLVAAEAVRETAPLSLSGLRAARPEVTTDEDADEKTAARSPAARPARQAEQAPTMPVVQAAKPAGRVESRFEALPPTGASEVAALPSMPASASAAAGQPAAAPLRAPSEAAAAVSQAPVATRRETVRVPMRLAAAGLRAEQLAGIIGVRAADLSIDFVDPAGLPALFGAQSAPELAYIRGVSLEPARARAATASEGGESGETTPPVTGAAPAAALPVGEAREAARAAALAPLVQRAAAGARLSAEEWALVATFPTASTAIQLAAARRSTSFLAHDSLRAAVAPERTFLSGAIGSAASFRGAVASRGGGFGGWDGGFVPSGLAAGGVSSRVFVSGGAVGGSRGGVGPSGAPYQGYAAGGDFGGYDGGSPGAGGGEGGSSGGGFAGYGGGGVPGSWSAAAPGAIWRNVGGRMEYVVPMSPDRARLPDGRQPRGGFIWPRAAGFTPTTTSAIEQATSSAERASVEAAPGSPLWEAMRPPPAMVQLQGAADRQVADSSAQADIELARPFLELVKGGLETRSEGVRFYEQEAPVAASMGPSSEAASSIVQAVRAQPQHSPGDDRISLGDLTLISVASATGQLAASPGGARPQAVAPGGGGGGDEHGHGGGGGGGGKHGGAPDLEELARKVYEELQRHIEIQGERNGHPWER